MRERKNLFVVRSPFQAWLCVRLIENLDLTSCDLLYITHNNSQEDRYYYELLSKKTDLADYAFVPSAQFDVLTHIKLRWRVRKWFSRRTYHSVYIASINSHIINALASRLSSAKLYTFDDGAANLVEDGPYRKSSELSLRFKLYRFIFRARSVEKILKRISKHYTIYRDCKNIVDEARIHYIEGWPLRASELEDRNNLSQVKRYFIGAPFHEVMSQSQIDAMIRFLSQIKIDGYIVHPREEVPLPIKAPVVDKLGRVAEDIIVGASRYYRVEIFGYLSTVMLNVKDYTSKRVVFIPEGHGTSAVLSLAKSSGCKVVMLSLDK